MRRLLRVIALSVLLLLLLVIALSVLLLLLLVVTLGVLLLLLLLIVTLVVLLLLLLVKARLGLLLIDFSGRKDLLDHGWLDIVHHHVGDQLLWHFFQHLLGQVASLDALIEFDELDDVTSAGLAYAVLESLTITIKLLHHRKVSVTYTDDDQ